MPLPPSPIRPKHRWLYPIDWRELSAFVQFQRAKGRCEHCGRPHGMKVRHLGDGRWYDEERRCWRNDRGQRMRGIFSPDRLPKQLRLVELAREMVPPRTRVVLASAHSTITLVTITSAISLRSASAAIWRMTGPSIAASAG